MIAHLLSSSTLLSGIVLALLVAWLIGSAAMTWRARKTVVGSFEEGQREMIHQARQPDQATLRGVRSETVPLPVIEAPE